MANETVDSLAAAPLPGASAGLFVRKSSGLVREMGTRDAASLGLGGVNAIATIAFGFIIILSLYPGVDLTWGWIIAGILMIPMTLMYAQLVSAFPRSGGDYVYVGRIFHPIVGATAGVAFLLFVMLNFAGNAVFEAEVTLANVFSTIGAAIHSTALVSFSVTLAKHWPTFISATVLTLASAFVALRGIHVLGRAMFYCIVVAVFTEVLFLILCLTHSGAHFVAAFNHSTGNPHAYAQVIAAARADHVPLGPHFSQVIKCLPYFAALGYWSFSFANFTGGELKRPSRTYLIATLSAVVVGAAMLVSAWLALRHMAGLEFLQSAANLSSTDPAKYTKITGDAPLLAQYYGSLVAGSGVIRVALNLGFMIGAFAFLLALMSVISRLIFALSFDRLLPTRLAEVGKKSHAPWAAIAVGVAGCLAFAALTVFSTGFITATKNAVIIAAALFMTTSVAAVAFIWRRGELFASSPKVWDGTFLGAPRYLYIALLQAAISIWLFVEAITQHNINNGFTTASIITIVIIGTAGTVCYGISRIYLANAKGIDLRLAMRDLPPE